MVDSPATTPVERQNAASGLDDVRPGEVPIPGRLRLVIGSVFAPVWSSGVVLFSCLFLPLGMVGGCGTKTPLYPYKD